MKIKFLTIFLCLATIFAMGQDELPYYEIPDYPESYTDCTVAARMIDGLGFRFYWASEGLTEKDLLYKPSESGRSCEETIDHILGLSEVIVKSCRKEVIGRTDSSSLTYKEKREKILTNLKSAADILRGSEDLSQFTLQFEGRNGISEYPFWNNINGPIADAIWHCGQLVVLRRASGNPFNSNVSVFSGKLRN